jgi:hypothetical protein
MEKFDICIPTLKKEEDFQPCLQAIHNTLNYNKIHIDRDPRGRGSSRVNLMKKVETQFFCFLDDDVVVNAKWCNKLIKKMESDQSIGAVSGFALTDNFLLNCLRKILMLRGLSKQRGFTSNTIIRAEAVKDIESLDNERFEDLQIQQHIKDQGYKWITIRAYCKHTKPGMLVMKEAWTDFKRLVKEQGFIAGLRKI